ncbi:MAG TPA: hypothetical protein VHZ55_17750 [Bryobacteraceae bacterium]|jgi:flagellar motility protein MotE (MotC chaperone)|nr:hypothetical protein [Bryobacteraceae bacterium]
MTGAESSPEPESDWTGNYFNYFTEIEEHFQRARGSGLFLLSPLDWALIEAWQQAGIPLAAVLQGIDDAFEKWRSRKQKRRLINSIAYCAQAVLEAAHRTPAEQARQNERLEPPFSARELRAHLDAAASAIQQRPEPALQAVGDSLKLLAAEAELHLQDLESLEQRLTALEEKLVAILRAQQSEEEMFRLREKLARELKPYRSKMTADQLSMLERRYLDTALLERVQLPRFSLFYLH